MMGRQGEGWWVKHDPSRYVADTADLDGLLGVAGGGNARAAKEDSAGGFIRERVDICDADFPAVAVRRRIRNRNVAAGGNEGATDSVCLQHRQNGIGRIAFGNAAQIKLHAGL